MNKTILAALCAFTFTGNAQAQNQPFPFNVVRAITNSVVQSGGNAQNANPADGILGAPPNGTPARSNVVLQYATKQAFLDAARNGELAGYARTSPSLTTVTAPVMNAIADILAHEYDTPVPRWNGQSQYAGGHSNDWCIISAVKDQMHTIVQTVTAATVASLSNQPPEFQNDHAEDKRVVLNNEFRSLRNMCYQMVLGTKKPYPFIDSFAALMGEYAKATDEAIASERARRKAKYQQLLAEKQAKDEQQAELARQAQAAQREQEQRQIDAEHKRIEEQERKAKENERNRVAG